MTRRSPKPLRKRLRSLYNWHRWLGVVSAVFVIWLSISGMLLEHSLQIGFAEKNVSVRWLQKRFSIDITAPESALKNDNHWLSQIDGRLYLNQQFIDHGAMPVGFCRLGLLWAVAERETLWLLNDKAEVLEKLEGLDLPGRILALSPVKQGLLIATTRGNFIADPLAADWPKWQASDLSTKPQYTLAALSETQQKQLVVLAEQRALNWERVLIAAHSGQLFGRYGVWLMDAMALSFIILAVTGLSLWLRYRRAASKRRRKLAGL